MTESERSEVTTEVGSSIFSEKSENTEIIQKSASKQKSLKISETPPEATEVIKSRNESRKATSRQSGRQSSRPSSVQNPLSSQAKTSRKSPARSKRKPTKKPEMTIEKPEFPPRRSLMLIPNGNVANMKHVWENKSTEEIDYRNWTAVNESYLRHKEDNKPISSEANRRNRPIQTDKIDTERSTSRKMSKKSKNSTSQSSEPVGDTQPRTGRFSIFGLEKSYIRFWNHVNSIGMTIFVNLNLPKKKSIKVVRVCCLALLVGIILRHTNGRAFDCLCFTPFLGTISLISLAVMILFDQ
jgi:hypothetical protein